MANINRWAGQVGLAFSDRKISDYITQLNVDKTSKGIPYLLVSVLDIDESIETENLENVVVAIFLFEEEILFVKMVGGNDKLEKQKNSFLAFINSITPMTS